MKKSLVVFVFVGTLLFTSLGNAQSRSIERLFVSFDQFVQELEGATFEEFAHQKAAKVRNEGEFKKMRQHLLSMYQGVDVTHSFALEDQIFDCVPIDQQPSVRQLGLDKIELEPPAPTIEVEGDGNEDPGSGIDKATSPLTLGLKDAFGHEVSCEEGTIPLRRVTLEEMTRFKTLEGFFRKTPWSEGGPLEGSELKKETHKYAHAYQSVKNYGGNSWLNLWSPAVNTGIGEVFSLSQQWYTGGSGKNLQTVEGGWQVYPAKYRTSKAALFIYWTADNYKSTGCYNLDCAGFVQTNSKWGIGGTWTSYSTRGGAQWEFQMQWMLYNGRWWLFLQGSGEYEAIGYYPASIFRGGQLTRFANRVDYGGETVGSSIWPIMGSGAFATSGPGQAAYQRRIFYLKTPGIENGGGIWADLKATQPSPKCYTLRYTPNSQAGSWGTFFYFGGPGGKSC